MSSGLANHHQDPHRDGSERFDEKLLWWQSVCESMRLACCTATGGAGADEAPATASRGGAMGAAAEVAAGGGGGGGGWGCR